MKQSLNNPAHLLSAFPKLQFNLTFDRWRKSHLVDMPQYMLLKPDYIHSFFMRTNLFTFDVYKNLLKYLNCWRIFFLTSLKNINFLTFPWPLKDLLSWPFPDLWQDKLKPVLEPSCPSNQSLALVWSNSKSNQGQPSNDDSGLCVWQCLGSLRAIPAQWKEQWLCVLCSE